MKKFNIEKFKGVKNMKKLQDVFEVYKTVYNFETKRMLYKVEENKKVSSLMDL